MKYSIIFLLSLFCFGQLRAQQNDKYQKFTKLRNGGIALAVAGGILTVVGVSVLGSAKTTTSNQYGQTEIDPSFRAGVYLVVGGVEMVGGGIVLAVIGAKKAKKYRPATLSMNMNLAPQMPPRVGLNLRF